MDDFFAYKLDLREHNAFNIWILSSVWIEADNLWFATTHAGAAIVAPILCGK